MSALIPRRDGSHQTAKHARLAEAATVPPMIHGGERRQSVERAWGPRKVPEHSEDTLRGKRIAAGGDPSSAERFDESRIGWRANTLPTLDEKIESARFPKVSGESLRFRPGPHEEIQAPRPLDRRSLILSEHKPRHPSPSI